jgi:hypothetical protein
MLEDIKWQPFCLVCGLDSPSSAGIFFDFFFPPSRVKTLNFPIARQEDFKSPLTGNGSKTKEIQLAK